MSTYIRALILCLAAVCALSAAPPALAEHSPPSNVSTAQRFDGQIISLLGPAASPTGIVLQLSATRTLTVRLTPRTIVKARSAEAQVEGLLVGDFAVVFATKPVADWNARRVTFDVDPFGPIRYFTITGTVVRLNRAGTRVQLTITGGTKRWIILTPFTHYAIDGIPSDTGLTPVRSNVLQVDVHSVPRGWVALLVNLKTTRSSAQSHWSER